MRDSINLLHVDRIDHGVGCFQDKELVNELVSKKIPLTICPVSNVKLGIYSSIKEIPIKNMLESGLVISINSDDPEMFLCDLSQNYAALFNNLGFTAHDVINCAKNSFISSFLPETEKRNFIEEVDKITSLYNDAKVSS